MRLRKFLLSTLAASAVALTVATASADIVTIGLENDNATGALLDNQPDTIADGLGPIVVQEALGTAVDGLTITLTGTTTAASGNFNSTGGTFGINLSLIHISEPTRPY